jgi:site-specific DNA-methyltransferase (cytosine-N4-specific)
MGVWGYGTDLNPLAIFLANAKLQALVTPAAELRTTLAKLSTRLRRIKRWTKPLSHDPRGLYLRSWFDSAILQIIEIVGAEVVDITDSLAPIFLAVASNLLRDYSLQDPHDLRIRRRKSPLPDIPFADAFLAACIQTIDRLDAAQAVLGTSLPRGHAALCGVTGVGEAGLPTPFDAALTSPPYAMALPYIDTQRLSLIWLGLLPAERILELESELIGSREMRGAKRWQIIKRMQENAAGLPEAEAAFCLKLQKALRAGDGFRRQAVPALLYRYLAAMRDSFHAIRSIMKPQAPFALIVGHNHTILGSVRYDINTPNHLASIALYTGWKVEDMINLQTYHRYGYHISNAVAAETLIILRNP